MKSLIKREIEGQQPNKKIMSLRQYVDEILLIETVRDSEDTMASMDGYCRCKLRDKLS